MRCWQCGEDLETESTVKAARESARADIITLLIRDAGAHRQSGRTEAANALEALADELLAAPVR
jgi:hypothetical protein